MKLNTIWILSVFVALLVLSWWVGSSSITWGFFVHGSNFGAVLDSSDVMHHAHLQEAGVGDVERVQAAAEVATEEVVEDVDEELAEEVRVGGCAQLGVPKDVHNAVASRRVQVVDGVVHRVVHHLGGHPIQGGPACHERRVMVDLATQGDCVVDTQATRGVVVVVVVVRVQIAKRLCADELNDGRHQEFLEHRTVLRVLVAVAHRAFVH